MWSRVCLMQYGSRKQDWEEKGEKEQRDPMDRLKNEESMLQIRADGNDWSDRSGTGRALKLWESESTTRAGRIKSG